MGEGKLPTLTVSFGRNNEVVSLMIESGTYRHGPISAIILYGCNLAKYLNVLRNAFNVPHSLAVTHVVLRWCSKRDYGMYLPGL